MQIAMSLEYGDVTAGYRCNVGCLPPKYAYGTASPTAVKGRNIERAFGSHIWHQLPAVIILNDILPSVIGNYRQILRRQQIHPCVYSLPRPI